MSTTRRQPGAVRGFAGSLLWGLAALSAGCGDTTRGVGASPDAAADPDARADASPTDAHRPPPEGDGPGPGPADAGLPVADARQPEAPDAREPFSKPEAGPLPGPEAGPPDAAVADVALPDLAVPDAALPDVAVPDVAVPDLAVPDTAVSDVAVPDVAVPDAAVPDIAVPDAAVPDAAVPDVAVPDAAVPDAAPPECLAGEMQAEVCGLNGRGASTRACAGGAFGPWSACVDPDVCVDGAEASRPCGADADVTETRVCRNGQWAAWSGCPALCDPDAHEPDDTWQLGVAENRRAPLGVDAVTALTLSPGDEDWVDFYTLLINYDLTATVRADDTCGPNDGGRLCAQMYWYTWVQDVELIAPDPVPITDPLCGDPGVPLRLDAGAVAGLAGEPWTSIVVHVWRAPGSPEVPIPYRIDVTRGETPF